MIATELRERSFLPLRMLPTIPSCGSVFHVARVTNMCQVRTLFDWRCQAFGLRRIVARYKLRAHEKLGLVDSCKCTTIFQASWSLLLNSNELYLNLKSKIHAPWSFEVMLFGFVRLCSCTTLIQASQAGELYVDVLCVAIVQFLYTLNSSRLKMKLWPWLTMALTPVHLTRPFV